MVFIVEGCAFILSDLTNSSAPPRWQLSRTCGGKSRPYASFSPLLSFCLPTSLSRAPDRWPEFCSAMAQEEYSVGSLSKGSRRANRGCWTAGGGCLPHGRDQGQLSTDSFDGRKASGNYSADSGLGQQSDQVLGHADVYDGRTASCGVIGGSSIPTRGGTEANTEGRKLHTL